MLEWLLWQGTFHGSLAIAVVIVTVTAGLAGIICGANGAAKDPRLALLGLLLSVVSLCVLVFLTIYFFTHLPVC